MSTFFPLFLLWFRVFRTRVQFLAGFEDNQSPRRCNLYPMLFLHQNRPIPHGIHEQYMGWGAILQNHIPKVLGTIGSWKGPHLPYYFYRNVLFAAVPAIQRTFPKWFFLRME